MHGERALFSTGIGFPQGGVCSAKFWLIAFNFAIKIINTLNIEGNGYADDCSALYGGRRLDHAISRLQKMLDSLTAWGRHCGLTFNPEKSVAVIFTRRQKVAPCPLYIDGKPIEYKQEVKYLGVTLDSKLHWKKHIDDKISKAKRFITQVANITRKNWGPKPRLMRWAYLGIVRPMVTYASMIWGHRASYHEKRLRRLNRMAINTMGSFPKSTPTAALEVMLDIMPLHLYCAQEALAARGRLHGAVSIDWDGLSHTKTHAVSHLRFLEDMLQSNNINLDNSDRCSELKWSSGFTINRDSFDGAAKHRTLSQYNVYTDGSRIEDKTGSGFAIFKGKHEITARSHRLPDHSTVFQAEIMAICKAAEEMLNLQTDNLRFVKFFVDSQAAIAALGNPSVKSKAVANAIDALNSLTSRASRVSIVWIPAHRGYAGNERADALAKLGAKSDNQAAYLPVGKPVALLKTEIRNISYQAWTKEWSQDPRFLHSKQFYGAPMPSKARYVYKLARLELGRFVRLITGHNNLNSFQTKIGLWGDSKCRLCRQAEETFLHFLHQCPRLHQARQNLFCDKLPGSDMQWSVRNLIDFSYTPTINAAFEGTWAHGDPANVDDMDVDCPLNDGADSDGDILMRSCSSSSSL